jgi:drug/metabolite transporter (DMT)-like permease
MAVQGAGGLLAQLAFAKAMRLADASLLVAVDFVRLPLAMAFGLALFGEPIEASVVIGGCIILGAVMTLFYRERSRLG